MEASTSKAKAGAGAGTKGTGEETVLPIPDLTLAQDVFVLTQAKCKHLHQQARTHLAHGIEKDEMGPYLRKLANDPSTSSFVPAGHASLLATLEDKNKQRLKEIEDKLQDAEKNLGETEITEALRERATYLAQIGEHEPALKAHVDALEKQAGLGQKIDIRLAMIRIGLFHADHAVISANMDAAQKLVDDGGDWDRRNRLKAYKGLYLLSIRNFKQGGQLLLDVISTFTATELVSYEDFVTLSVIAGTLVLDRKDIKKKLIESPEVLSVLPSVPSLDNFASSLYKCQYAHFFRALATVEEKHLLPSRLLATHARYYVREMRIKAYAQLLESYRSVTMKNLSASFGMSPEFIDADLSRFIAAGRLNCSIDRVNGVVETNRPDTKNARYEAVVKQGDVLLTSIQRLSRVIG